MREGHSPPPPDIPSLPSVGLFSAVRRASPRPRSCTRHIAARAHLRERRGFGCQRLSGSEPRAPTLHLPAHGTGWGSDIRVKRGGYRAALCSEAFPAPLFCCRKELQRFEKRKIRFRPLEPNHQFMRRRIRGPEKPARPGNPLLGS